jgi:hypothetical protein
MAVEREFPFPKVVGTALQRHHEPVDLEHEPIPDFVSQPSKRVDHIRGWFRLLTHREMRDFVREIFDAHEQLFPQNEGSVIAKSIKAGELADVLDKIAHGD